jgi:hypothetical protein
LVCSLSFNLSLDSKFDRVGAAAAALCWAIWLSRNDVVFNSTKSNSSMQVTGIYWIRSWLLLFKEFKDVERNVLKTGCRNLEVTFMKISIFCLEV